MRVEEARALELPVAIEVAGTPIARRKYGIHAGQQLLAVDTRIERGMFYLVAECEDEHLVDVRPVDAEVAWVVGT